MKTKIQILFSCENSWDDGDAPSLFHIINTIDLNNEIFSLENTEEQLVEKIWEASTWLKWRVNDCVSMVISAMSGSSTQGKPELCWGSVKAENFFLLSGDMSGDVWQDVEREYFRWNDVVELLNKQIQNAIQEKIQFLSMS